MSTFRKDNENLAAHGAASGDGRGAAANGPDRSADSAAGASTGVLVAATPGDGIAEAMNPAAHDDYWRDNYASRPYFVSGREWTDYEPAYRYGYKSFGAHRGRHFAEVESDLKRQWDTVRGKSRLMWEEAKEAVRDGWRHVERAMPGDADRDGR